MKIYNEVKIDIDTGDILYEDSYEYDGAVDYVGGADIGTIVYYVIYILIIAISAYISYNNLPDVNDSVPERGIELNTRTSSASLPIIYGTRRVGGNDIYINTNGYHSKVLRIVQTLSEGEIEGIYQVNGVDQVFVDDKIYTKYGVDCDYKLYTGTPTQTYDTDLHDFDNSWIYNLRRTAYISWYFYYDENKYTKGKPKRLLIVKGIKCNDFRTSDSTNVWTANPVLCLYDFMTSTQYGLGIPTSKFDLTSWTSAANYVESKGWELNICHMGDDNGAWDFVQTILLHMRGYLNWWNGKYHLKIRDLYEEASVMNITDEHIYQNADGKAEIKIIEPSRFNKPNGLEVTFIDENNDYVENYIYLGDRDGVIQTLNLPGCTNYKMAADLGLYHLERLRLNRTLSGKFRSDCIQIEPGDIITLTSSSLFIYESLMRVISTNINTDDTIDIVMQYESYDLYDDNYDEDSSNVYQVNLPNPSEFSTIENSSMREETIYHNLKYYTKLFIDFTIPDDDPWFDYVEVWVSVDGDVEENYKHQTNAKNSFYIESVNVGYDYWIILRPVNIWNVKAPWDQSPKLFKKILGYSNVRPPSPNELFASPGTGVVNLKSEKIYSPDIEHYEFRFGNTWQSASFLSSIRSPNYSINGIKPSGETAHIFWLNTRGSNDLYGETPTSDSVFIPNPIGFTEYISFTFDSTGLHYFDNTEVIEYNQYGIEEWIGIDSTSMDTTGVFISEIYDTETEADEYYVYIDNEMTVIGAGTTWADQFVGTWSDVDAKNRSWLQILETDEAPNIKIKIAYKVLPENDWDYIEDAQLISGVIVARYFRVEIYITNPNSQTRGIISSYTLNLLTRN